MNKISCPKCSSYMIRNSKAIGFMLLFIGLATFIFIFGFFFLFVGFAMMLAGTQYTCESCGFKFKKKDILFQVA